MMQVTDNPILQKQINAGTKGRKKGHSYEMELAQRLNVIQVPFVLTEKLTKIVNKGNPEIILIKKVLEYLEWEGCTSIKAYATGKLATAESGNKMIELEGHSLHSCKSDVVMVVHSLTGEKEIVGISVKQCNNKTPTNAQVFFSTAMAFCNLLVSNGVNLSSKAVTALRQFCGDNGFRPLDDSNCADRVSTPERYFWEEVDADAQSEWERIMNDNQDLITRLLLQKAYSKDPFPPHIILHKTKKADSANEQEVAVFTVEELVKLSRQYSSFTYSRYRVKKGRYKEPDGVSHLAPRFGVIQMQRGGQKQHPTQLQFNLKAGYFYELDNM